MIKKLIKSSIEKIFRLARYKVTISRIKPKTNYTVVDKNVWTPYLCENQKMQLYFDGLSKSRVEGSDNFFKQLRSYNLQQLVHWILERKIEGDFVECGVWKGHSAYVISSILAENEFTGEFHIFDSFEGGLSKKVRKDENLRYVLTNEQIQRESSSLSSTEREVMKCLEDFRFTRLYKGWIPDRFLDVGDRHFSFVHIDVDLYEPTLDCLMFFYPKLVKDGVIVCDDYGISQFPGAKRAVDKFLENNICKVFYEVPMGGCFLIK